MKTPKELANAWLSNYQRMSALAREGNGKLSDVAFAEYRGCEDAIDGIESQLTQRLGRSFGPTIRAEMTRSERLAARAPLEGEAVGLSCAGGLDPTLEGQRLNGSFGGGVFRNFGEQLQSVIRAGSPGNAPDARLYQVRAAAGMSEGVGADGGFLVQNDFSLRLLNSAMEQAKLAPRCAKFPIGAGANSVDLPYVSETSRATGSRFGGMRLYWTAEAGEKTATKPKFDKLSLKLNKLTGLVYLTDELVQDVNVLSAYVERAFRSEFAWTVDNVILRGNGVGQPLGILNADCLVTVAKESGQAAATINALNVEKMFSRLLPGGEDRAVWLVNQGCWPQLLSLRHTFSSESTVSVPLFLPNGNLAGSPFGTLLGRPIIVCEQCSALGSVGDIVLADFGRYLLADKGGIEAASSMHVRFIYDESVLRFVYRVDGRPELPAAKTPANGTDTLSPFIALAERA